MFCTKCGSNNENSTGFCINCGAKLESVQANIQQPVYNQQPVYTQQPMYTQPQPMQQPIYAQPVYTQPMYGQPYVRPAVSVYRPNVFGIIATLVFLAGIFFPLISFDGFGVSLGAKLIDGSDWIFVVFISIFTLAFSIADLNIVVLVFSIFACIFSTIELFNVLDKTRFGSYIKPGVGFFLLVIGSILLLIAAIVGISSKSRRRNNALMGIR